MPELIATYESAIDEDGDILVAAVYAIEGSRMKAKVEFAALFEGIQFEAGFMEKQSYNSVETAHNIATAFVTGAPCK